MRYHIYTLCVLLLLAAPLHAAETLDEKVYDPGQQTAPASPSATPGTTPGATPGVAPSVPHVRVTPGQTMPSSTPDNTQGDTIIVLPTTPAQPDTQKETPSLVIPVIPPVPPVPTIPVIPVVPTIPEAPKAPEADKKDSIVTPTQPVQAPAVTAPKAPETEDKLLTPADFLPTTPQQKDAEKGEPKIKAQPETKPDAKKDKAKSDQKSEQKKEPKPDLKKDPKKDPKKDKTTPEKKKGEALRIPPEAAQSGNMDFLEGCWKGRLSGRAGREVIDNMGSRFCFDDKGKGKHFLYDPKRNETCVGSANGGIKTDGTLRVDFDNLYCPSGETWYPQGDKYMTCRDGGNGADCKWYYKGKPRTTGPFYRD